MPEWIMVGLCALAVVLGLDALRAINRRAVTAASCSYVPAPAPEVATPSVVPQKSQRSCIRCATLPVILRDNYRPAVMQDLITRAHLSPSQVEPAGEVLDMLIDGVERLLQHRDGSRG